MDTNQLVVGVPPDVDHLNFLYETSNNPNNLMNLTSEDSFLDELSPEALLTFTPDNNNQMAPFHFSSTNRLSNSNLNISNIKNISNNNNYKFLSAPFSAPIFTCGLNSIPSEEYPLHYSNNNNNNTQPNTDISSNNSNNEEDDDDEISFVGNSSCSDSSNGSNDNINNCNDSNSNSSFGVFDQYNHYNQYNFSDINTGFFPPLNEVYPITEMNNFFNNVDISNNNVENNNSNLSLPSSPGGESCTTTLTGYSSEDNCSLNSSLTSIDIIDTLSHDISLNSNRPKVHLARRNTKSSSIKKTNQRKKINSNSNKPLKRLQQRKSSTKHTKAMAATDDKSYHNYKKQPVDEVEDSEEEKRGRKPGQVHDPVIIIPLNEIVPGHCMLCNDNSKRRRGRRYGMKMCCNRCSNIVLRDVRLIRKGYKGRYQELLTAAQERGMDFDLVENE